jgi:hypothetical protein
VDVPTFTTALTAAEKAGVGWLLRSLLQMGLKTKDWQWLAVGTPKPKHMHPHQRWTEQFSVCDIPAQQPLSAL